TGPVHALPRNRILLRRSCTMLPKLYLALATLTALTIAGCATGSTHSNTSGFADLDSLTRTSGAYGTIITADKLRYESGSVLDAMIRHVINLRVDKSYNCPSLGLRGINTSPGIIEPVIYVDGIKAVDTCI